MLISRWLVSRCLLFIGMVSVLSLLNACSGGGTSSSNGPVKGRVTRPGTIYQPPPGTTWQWQLSGTLNTSYNVDVYDIDLFDTPKATIESLQARGIKVICYFSAGSFENWREDAANFPKAALGNTIDGWAGERWLDIRNSAVRSLMENRLDKAVEKGCDGVEPDNVDGYTNAPGFPLTAVHQLDYNKFLAIQAHQRNLSIGLKNDLDQVPELVDDFDFAVNEQCHEYDECEALQPFINSNKAVFNAEYKAIWRTNASSRAQLCQASVNTELSTLVLPVELDDSFRFSCRGV